MHDALHELTLDAVTREVVDALRAEGVRPLLIKGPALTRWLYRGTPSRAYLDVDLLVSEAEWPAATRVLGELGFESQNAGFSQTERDKLSAEHQIAQHAEAWTRPSGIEVDLHHTIVGVVASDGELWEALASNTEGLALGGGTVDIPAEPSRVLIVVLEAAKAGFSDEKGIANLSRALEIVGEPLWHEAAELARRLRSEAPFAAGLRLLPEGQELAARLRLSNHIDVETALLASAAPPTALGFQHFAETRGLRAKARFVASEVVPSKVFMRSRFEIARRGTPGLVLAYLWRPVWLAIHAVTGLVAWRRARKESL